MSTVLRRGQLISSTVILLILKYSATVKEAILLASLKESSLLV